MKQLPNKLNDEQVERLAVAGRVQFDKFLRHDDNFFAKLINRNRTDYDLYGNTGSYNIIRRNVVKYLREKGNYAAAEAELNKIKEN